MAFTLVANNRPTPIGMSRRCAPDSAESRHGSRHGVAHRDLGYVLHPSPPPHGRGDFATRAACNCVTISALRPGGVGRTVRINSET